MRQLQRLRTIIEQLRKQNVLTSEHAATLLGSTSEKDWGLQNLAVSVPRSDVHPMNGGCDLFPLRHARALSHHSQASKHGPFGGI